MTAELVIPLCVSLISSLLIPLPYLFCLDSPDQWPTLSRLISNHKYLKQVITNIVWLAVTLFADCTFYIHFILFNKGEHLWRRNNWIKIKTKRSSALAYVISQKYLLFGKIRIFPLFLSSLLVWSFDCIFAKLGFNFN